MCTKAEYEEYLDEVKCVGYGGLLRQAAPVTFCVGYVEWARENDCEEWEDCDEVE